MEWIWEKILERFSAEEIAELLRAGVLVDPVESADPGIQCDHWMGWARYSDAQIADLKGAGVTRLIFNLNKADARGKWEWDGKRSKILAEINRALALGFDVGLMPWVWAGHGFMDVCGKNIKGLIADMDAMPALVQLDWEGSAEYSAKTGAGISGDTKEKDLTSGDREKIAAVVDKGLISLCNMLHPCVPLGITTLYFRRTGGDAASRWSHTANGHTWRIKEQTCQAYSVWDKGNKATLKDNYQPPRLQARCAKFHEPLRDLFSRWGMGVAGWKLTRPGMTAREAMEAQVRGCLDAGVQVFNVWGGHLMDRGTGYEAERFDLALDAYRRVSGVQMTAEHAPMRTDRILWDEIYHSPGLARGGGPPGYRLPKPLGRVREVGGLGDEVEATLRWALLQTPPRGWVVPVDLGARGRAAVVVQHHPWTHKNGKKVWGDFTGATLYFEA